MACRQEQDFFMRKSHREPPAQEVTEHQLLDQMLQVHLDCSRAVGFELVLQFLLGGSGQGDCLLRYAHSNDESAVSLARDPPEFRQLTEEQKEELDKAKLNRIILAARFMRLNPVQQKLVNAMSVFNCFFE